MYNLQHDTSIQVAEAGSFPKAAQALNINVRHRGLAHRS